MHHETKRIPSPGETAQNKKHGICEKIAKILIFFSSRCLQERVLCNMKQKGSPTHCTAAPQMKDFIKNYFFVPKLLYNNYYLEHMINRKYVGN